MAHDDLDDVHALARTEDPDTSHEAAESLEGDVSRLMKLVLETTGKIKGPVTDPKTGEWENMVGATADEVATALNLRLNTISPRFAPLERREYLIKVGKRRNASTRRYAWVYRPTGRQYTEETNDE